MTLHEALEVLQRAGRIRSAWLPGMLVRKSSAPGIQLRLTEATWTDPPDWELCVTDPATVGCLAALAREASGEVLIAQYRDVPAGRIGSRSVRPWVIIGPQSTRVAPWVGADGDTEGEAWAAALIALAEAP